MDALIQSLPFETASLTGLSARLIDSHHRNNYARAVKRLNGIRAQLGKLNFEAAPGFSLNGLKGEELIADISMALHELYFASLAGGIDGWQASGRPLVDKTAASSNQPS